MYFLGIVVDARFKKSDFTPDYVLCRNDMGSVNRSGMIVVSTATTERRFPKLLVPDMTGHDDLINFLSNYRTRKKQYRSKGRRGQTLKRPVYGWLCWFESDYKGTPRGVCVPIKHVPDKTVSGTNDEGWQRYQEIQKDKKRLSYLYSRYTLAEDGVLTEIKKQLPQVEEKVPKSKRRKFDVWRSMNKIPHRSHKEVEALLEKKGELDGKYYQKDENGNYRDVRRNIDEFNARRKARTERRRRKEARLAAAAGGNAVDRQLDGSAAETADGNL